MSKSLAKRGKRKTSDGQLVRTLVVTPSGAVTSSSSSASQAGTLSILPEPPGARVLTTEEAAYYCGVDIRTIQRWVERGDVASPRIGFVFLQSVFDYFRITAGTLDERGKNEVIAKVIAERKRIEVETDYRSQLILDSQHRRMIDLTSDERKAGALHAKMLLAVSEHAREIIAQSFLDSVRHADDPYEVTEALAELADTRACDIINRITRHCFGDSGLDYTKGSLYAEATGSAAQPFDRCVPYWIPPVTLKGVTTPGTWEKWIDYTAEEIAEHAKVKGDTRSGGYFVKVDAPPPTASPELILHKLAEEVERQTDRRAR